MIAEIAWDGEGEYLRITIEFEYGTNTSRQKKSCIILRVATKKRMRHTQPDEHDRDSRDFWPKYGINVPSLGNFIAKSTYFYDSPYSNTVTIKST